MAMALGLSLSLVIAGACTTSTGTSTTSTTSSTAAAGSARTAAPSTGSTSRTGSTAATGSTPAATIDDTHLPVGDYQTASAPERGKVFACRTQAGGGGASEKGPWFNADGTWDLTKKLYVQGDVQWDAATVSITVDGDERVITANALPEHGTGVFPVQASDPAYAYDRNPNTIKAQSLSLRLPTKPTVAASGSCIGGEVAIATNGVPLFNAFDAGNRDAGAWEVQDNCHGHPQIAGMYHYHDISSCLDTDGTGHSELIAYAFDGFGVFGVRGEGGQQMTNAELDECHGHTHTITWDGAEVEMYHYHATHEFPYSVSCFRGTSSQSGPLG